MPHPITIKQKRRTQVARAIAAVALLVPVAIYLWQFGLTVSSDHTRWSEFGSAMGGIYAPVLALLTLAVLIVQLQTQARLNEHTFDTSYVQDARGDLQFFLDHLRDELDKEFASGVSFKDTLVSGFSWLSENSLTDPTLAASAKALNHRNNRLVALWSGVYGVFAGLGTHNYPPYSNNYVTARLKAVAILSYECCVALDNLSWLSSEGRLGSRTEFSSILPNASDERNNT